MPTRAVHHQDLNIASSQYAGDGVTVLRGAIEPDTLRRIRREIAGVIEEVTGLTSTAPLDPDAFSRWSTEVLWDAIVRHPSKRNLLYTYVQRVPTLYELANAPALRSFAEAVSIRKPSVRESKVQIFFPWEKLF